MNEKIVVLPQGLFVPAAPYSLALRKGNMLFVSGIVSVDVEGRTLGSTIGQQTRNVLEVIRKILAREGADLDAIMKTTVYLPDFADYAGMNAVYAEYFPNQPPARATVGVKLIKPEWLVEIDATAVL